MSRGGDWQDEGIVGIARFLKRVYSSVVSSEDDKNFPPKADQPRAEKLEKLTHKTIKKVTEDIEKLQYNTAIAFLMEYVNGMQSAKYSVQDIEILLKLLAPFAPHLTEELWREALGHKTSIHSEAWPEYDPEKIKEEKVVMVIQVNGKVRSQIEVDTDMEDEKIKFLALNDKKVAKWLEGKEPKKVIVVRGRVVSIVV